MNHIDPVAALAAVASLLALARSFIKPKLSLEQVCELAFDHGEQLGKTPDEKRRISLQAAQRIDMRDGRADWDDAQLRIGLEAVAARRRAARAQPSAVP